VTAGQLHLSKETFAQVEAADPTRCDEEDEPLLNEALQIIISAYYLDAHDLLTYQMGQINDTMDPATTFGKYKVNDGFAMTATSN